MLLGPRLWVHESVLTWEWNNKDLAFKLYNRILHCRLYADRLIFGSLFNGLVPIYVTE